VMLLYPSFGITEKNLEPDNRFFTTLNDNDIYYIFKTAFDTNNKDTLKRFFSNDFINRVYWPIVLSHVKDKDFFTIKPNTLLYNSDAFR
jgi:hypothetical protein